MGDPVRVMTVAQRAKLRKLHMEGLQRRLQAQGRKLPIAQFMIVVQDEMTDTVREAYCPPRHEPETLERMQSNV